MALAGAYPATALPLWIGALVLAAAERPRFPAAARSLDASLILVAAAVAVQLAPLGLTLVRTIDPAAPRLWGTLIVGGGAASTISIAPLSTAAALLMLVGSLVIFWTCRDLAGTGGETIARTVAVLGLLVSLVAIVQASSATHRLYGLITPHDPDATVFGPFVNRDHFATWTVMAVPLTLGALMTHARRHADRGRAHVAWTARLGDALNDTVAFWMAAALVIMTIALIATGSRSGLMGLATAIVAGTWLARGRLTFTEWRRLWLAAIPILLVIATCADFARLATRVSSTLPESGAYRLFVWRDTLRIVHDFWLTGTGAGTYGLAMLVYQTFDRHVFFNQAHDHYLQLLAEGGVLVAVPVLLASLALAIAIRRALRSDRTSRYWLRAGATAGLCGVAVQSLWETGLRMPANAVLCAVLAALATYEGRDEKREARSE